MKNRIPAIDPDFENCRIAASELEDKFRYEKWFSAACPGLKEGVDVIYLWYHKYCPERNRLYLFKSFPVIMSLKVPANVGTKSEDLCTQGQKTERK